MFTKQEVYDQVVEGLKGQGYQQALNPVTGACVFRGENGTKCAVGQILPDDIANRMMEQGTNYFSPELNQIPGMDDSEHYPLLHLLMNAHDKGHSPILMMEKLRYVANIFGLDSSRVQ